MKQTCRIGRGPPRNIVPTRAERSLLKLYRVQPILCNTAPTAQMLSIHSTSERKNSRIEKVTLPRQREFCSVAVRLFVPTRAERYLFRLCRVQPNLLHLCTNFPTATLFLSMFRGLFDSYLLGVPSPLLGFSGLAVEPGSQS